MSIYQTAYQFFLAQYNEIPLHLIILEMTAALFGLLSVLCAKKQSIWVYPSGLISTTIYIYILYVYGLWGNMLINSYYSLISCYGWYLWSRKMPDGKILGISYISPKEWQQVFFIFSFSFILVGLIYRFNATLENSWEVFIDILTTAIFFVAMLLMAKKKIEHWLFWILGDTLSVPLYLAKNLNFTALQYSLFTIIAIGAFFEWKKEYSLQTKS